MSQSATVESNSIGLLSKPEVGNTGSLSAEEAKLYDRQIRLWGVDAQRRMRDSRVLLVGFGSLNAEVCKNLVLAGINHVTILETHTATPEDLGAHIFLEPSHIGSNRASACVENIKLLNPTATIAVVEGNVESQTDDFFKSFTVACATNCMLTSLYHLNKVTRDNNLFFFSADAYGMMGYFFSDLKTYSYVKKEADGETSETVTVKFSSFEEAMTQRDWSKMRRTPSLYFGLSFIHQFKNREGRGPSVHEKEDEGKMRDIAVQTFKEKGLSVDVLPQDFISQLVANASSEISPVSAIIGGILGQEIIKVLSGKEEPLSNFFFYNALSLRNPGETARIPASF
ncbi:SUMO-activating enzyme subunit 1-like [Planoprotostelium fungivorum]|uniref:Ubiquitin-like 1-activating enzyme E1A n=1 Tax=Planoprotostelium fungivorum TaxID=1890364 RepID=A0A2P6N906_9EUKA|nr:SUMO-activating enzyme subunit 1-like [Planoprotostelium fungivorum]